jgi:hypothetical protein
LPLAQGAAPRAVEDDELHADIEREVALWGVWGIIPRFSVVG